MIRMVGMGYNTTPDYSRYGQSDTTGFLAGLRSYMNQTLSSAYLQVHIDESASAVDTIRVNVNWRTVRKNASGSYGTLSDGLWSNFESPSTECNPKTSSKYSGTDFSIELGNIGEYLPGGTSLTPSGTSLRQQIAPNGYSFANRVYDAVSMFFTVVVTYTDGTPESRYVANEFFFVYFPVYTLTGLTMDEDGVTVSYTCGDWNRADDRWEAVSFYNNGAENGINILRSDSVPYVTFGNIDAPGRITMPLSAFTRLPVGSRTYVKIRMNASFRAEGEDWGYIDGTVNLVNEGDCNTPTLSFNEPQTNADVLAVNVGDSGDKGVPIDTVYVTLRDQSGADTTVTTVPGGTVRFPYPPLNTQLTVDAIGYSEDGNPSEVVTATHAAIYGAKIPYTTIAAEDGSASVTLRFNVSMDWTFEPVANTVKFSGRSRETTMYGIGGSVVGNLSCDILDDDKYGDLHQSRRDFEALAFAGICILRDTDGSRKRVAIDSVGESWDRVRFVKTMNLQVREVQ